MSTSTVYVVGSKDNQDINKS